MVSLLNNGFSFFDPRWYSTEFTNMVNEFDAPDAYSKGYKEDNGIFSTMAMISGTLLVFTGIY